jgi:hypothetical protein
MNTYFVKLFNNKLQVMNNTQNKQLVLSNKESQGLQSEIYELLTRIAELEKLQEQKPTEELIRANVDGGSW